MPSGDLNSKIPCAQNFQFSPSSLLHHSNHLKTLLQIWLAPLNTDHESAQVVNLSEKVEWSWGNLKHFNSQLWALSLSIFTANKNNKEIILTTGWRIGEFHSHFITCIRSPSQTICTIHNKSGCEKVGWDWHMFQHFNSYTSERSQTWLTHSNANHDLQ